MAWFTDDQLTDKSATTWDSTVAERWREKGWPVSQLYTRADTGEVERLRRDARNDSIAYKAAIEKQDELRAHLSERDALLAKALAYLKDIAKSCDEEKTHFYVGCLANDAIDALSASAEPSAPKCKTCGDLGIVRGITGQHPNAKDAGRVDCPKCRPSAPDDRSVIADAALYLFWLHSGYGEHWLRSRKTEVIMELATMEKARATPEVKP